MTTKGKALRDGVKSMKLQAYQTFWHSQNVDTKEVSVAAYMPVPESLSEAIALLDPATPMQKS